MLKLFLEELDNHGVMMFMKTWLDLDWNAQLLEELDNHGIFVKKCFLLLI